MAKRRWAIQADQRIASAGYFETMKIPLIKGRFFNDHDRKESLRVALIDENMARTYWPNGNALGKRLKLGSGKNNNPWLTVVDSAGEYHPTQPQEHQSGQ